MGKALRTARRRGQRSESEPARAVLGDLERRFREFRRSHPGGTRIPDALRAAVLAALDNGVAPGEVYRTCRISWGQVNAWKGKAAGGDATDVRVFSVVDGAPACDAEERRWQEGSLELRLGPWSVSVQLADPATSPARGA